MTTDIKTWIAAQAANIVNGARRKGYGTPENNFHRIGLLWQAWLEARGFAIIPRSILAEEDKNYIQLAEVKIDAKWVSPMMRLMKEARLCETPDHLDSLTDLVGYTLTGAEVNGVQVPEAPLSETNREAYEQHIRNLEGMVESLNKQLHRALQHPTELPIASTDPVAASSKAVPEVPGRLGRKSL